jgi:hypothetical protein
MKRYKMTGAQRIQLESGRQIEPGSGEFSADISPAQEAWFLEIHALALVEEQPSAPVADNEDADFNKKPARRR